VHFKLGIASKYRYPALFASWQDRSMELSRILTPDRIRVPLAPADKTGIITQLIDVLADAGVLRDRDAALEAVLRREAKGTTGIGYGLAIPHEKTASCTQLVMAAGKPAAPVDFQSLDGRPVTFVVLLLSPPDQPGPHIQALAKISRLMNIEDFRQAVARAQSAQELHRAIAAFEAADAPAKP
jgi:mannitol/fructose-specific phosphotransferase system IIA component (Ntr-type)